jgi:CheY-like chemotaxis protein
MLLRIYSQLRQASDGLGSHIPFLLGVDGMPVFADGSRVLIVDDEVAIADSLAMIFTSRRYDVRVAYSGEEAIDVIAQWQPDLAILDVVLPGMSGIDLAIATRVNYPSCRIILFSGNVSTSSLLEEAAKKGYSFDVLAKPVHPELMLEAASSLLSLERGPEAARFD